MGTMHRSLTAAAGELSPGPRFERIEGDVSAGSARTRSTVGHAAGHGGGVALLRLSPVPMLPLMNVDLSMAVDLARCPLEASEADLTQLRP